MSIALSSGVIQPSGCPKRVQLVATASMLKRTRASVATIVISGELPPWAFSMTNLRMPCCCKILGDAEPALAPLRRRPATACLPHPYARSNSRPVPPAGRSPARRAAIGQSIRSTSPSAISVSVSKGRCGPCCSCAPSGKHGDPVFPCSVAEDRKHCLSNGVPGMSCFCCMPFGCTCGGVLFESYS